MCPPPKAGNDRPAASARVESTESYDVARDFALALNRNSRYHGSFWALSSSVYSVGMDWAKAIPLLLSLLRAAPTDGNEALAERYRRACTYDTSSRKALLLAKALFALRRCSPIMMES